MSKFNPIKEALAFRIWVFAKSVGWDCTIAEVVIAVEEEPDLVKEVIRKKAWCKRFRRYGNYQLLARTSECGWLPEETVYKGQINHDEESIKREAADTAVGSIAPTDPTPSLTMARAWL